MDSSSYKANKIRLLLVAPVVVLGALLTSCASEQSASKPSVGSAFFLSARETAQVARLTDESLRDCMKRKGFEYSSQRQPPSRFLRTKLEDWIFIPRPELIGTYGFGFNEDYIQSRLNAQFQTKFGDSLTEPQLLAYSAALYGAPTDLGGTKTTGCVKTADSAVVRKLGLRSSQAVVTEKAEKVFEDYFEEFGKNKRIQAALAGWKECMKLEGF
jgi:hypothetical protein